MASFAELNPAPVLRANVDGIILSCNPASLEILGKNAKKGTSIASLLPDLSEVSLHKCIQGNMLLSQEVDIKGRSYQFIIRGVSDLNLLHVYGSDITERKQSEEQMSQMRSELLHSARVGTMSEFTASLAHEINHPLGSILNYANAAKRYLEKMNPDLDKIREIIACIISEDKRADDVIQKLRALMKKEETEFVPLSVDAIIEEVLALTHSELVIEGISLSRQLETDLPKVNADRIQFQQVLLNLIINATDAMKESKVKNLSISASKKDAQNIVVCVMDSGEGIDENRRESLFEPFFTTKTKGMGMGLCVSKTIIRAFGGDIWIENNKDGGASFFLTLPVYEETSS
jgi:two-component system sensor kinase FixL